MVSLQNRQNKEVIRKILQVNELCEVLVPSDRFRLEEGAKTPGIIVRRITEIICKRLRPPAVGQSLAFRSHGHSWCHPSQSTRRMGHSALRGWGSWSPTSATQNAADMGTRQRSAGEDARATAGQEAGATFPSLCCQRPGRLGRVILARQGYWRIVFDDVENVCLRLGSFCRRS